MGAFPHPAAMLGPRHPRRARRSPFGAHGHEAAELSGAGARVWHVVARCRVLESRATLVRPWPSRLAAHYAPFSKARLATCTADIAFGQPAWKARWMMTSFSSAPGGRLRGSGNGLRLVRRRLHVLLRLLLGCAEHRGRSGGSRGERHERPNACPAAPAQRVVDRPLARPVLG